MILKPIYEIKIIHTDNIDKPNLMSDSDKLQHVISIKIDEDVNKLTNTAQIELPIKNIILPTYEENYIRYENDDTGRLYYNDKIEIYLGYNGLLEQVFVGYFVNFNVTEKSVIIECEDYMYYWKKQPKVLKSYDTIKVVNLLSDLGFDKLKGTWNKNNIIDFTLPKIRTTSPLTPAEILKMLKDNYNFFAYYLRGELHVGHKYPLNNTKSNPDSDTVYAFDYPYFDFINTDLGKTIYTSDNQQHSYPIIKSNVKKIYTNKELISIVNITDADNSKRTYYLTSTSSTGKVKQGTVTSAFDDYEKVIINDVNLAESEAIDICEQNYMNALSNSYNGNFTTFGFPTLYPSDTILLAIDMLKHTIISNIDKDIYKNIDLNYFVVEKTTKTFSSKGYFQTVYLDKNYLSDSHITKN